MGNLQQLQIVELECIKDSEIELCLIKSLLGYCSLLKKMFIHNQITTTREYPAILGVYPSIVDKYGFARRLLMLHRASPIAELDLY